MYGAQTKRDCIVVYHGFENDVEMYGAQTLLIRLCFPWKFENDVEMYGAQTMWQFFHHLPRLRMM